MTRVPPPLPHAAITQPERTLLACSLAAGLFGLLFVFGVSHGWAPWGCAWKAFTGWPCAGCGGTRTLLLLAGGHWLEALAMNPGVVAALLLLALANGYAALVVGLRLRPWRPGWWPVARWRWFAAAAFFGNWLYLLAAGTA